MQLHFRTLSETSPDDAWRAVVERGWPGWRRWYLDQSSENMPDLATSRRALRRHMPEMDRIIDKLINAVDGDELLTRFLTFWTPPRYLAHCSQIAFVDDEGPVLVRNYDLNPELSESTLLHSRWLAKPVVGMVDGLNGLADGMNEPGLAVSLAFGGRAQMGRGFGIPLIVRYILETCRDVADATEALRLLPSHMSYNLTLIDRTGARMTAFVAPDRPMILREQAIATNHQIGVEWEAHATQSRTIEREQTLQALAANPMLRASDAVAALRSKPIFAYNPARQFFTLYTIMYRPLTGQVRLLWPDGRGMDSSLAVPGDGETTIDFPTAMQRNPFPGGASAAQTGALL